MLVCFWRGVVCALLVEHMIYTGDRECWFAFGVELYVLY